MKTANILSKTITAAATLLLCGLTAHAANLVNNDGTAPGAGELFVGLHATGGFGNGKSVVIDVGAASPLSALSVGSTLGLGNIGTDLIATFGATWFDRTDLLWSAVSAVQVTVPSTSTDFTNTLYGSVQSNGAFPLTTAAYNRGTNSAQSSVALRIIGSMAAGIGGFTSATTGSLPNVAIESPTDQNNYALWMPGGASVSGLGDAPFGGFANPTSTNFEQAFAAGSISLGVEGSLDVYREYRSTATDPDASPTTGTGAGSYQFTLKISNLGAITANVLPVPEPASIGLLLTGGVVFLGLRRRGAAARAAALSA